MTNDTNKIRIQKFLSNRGICSRRAAERLINDKRIKVNGKLATIGLAVDDNDFIKIDDKLIQKNDKKVYFLLNKPKGYISSRTDPLGKAITDLIKTKLYIWPVGRLDVNTTGLILLTNDGDLTNKMLHPSYKVTKTYIAKVNSSNINEQMISQLYSGVKLDTGYVTKKLNEIRIIKQSENYSHVLISLSEGKQNQIKKMFLTQNLKVMELNRISIGNIKIDSVPNRGQYIQLEKKTILNLLNGS